MNDLKFFFFILILSACESIHHRPSKKSPHINATSQSPLQANGTYQIKTGETLEKEVFWTTSYKFTSRPKQLVRIKFNPQSPLQKYTGFIFNHESKGPFLPAVGKLEYKNGDVYIGSFYERKYTGLGYLKKNGKVLNGVFLDGELVKALNENMQFDFNKILLKYDRNKLYTQENGMSLHYNGAWYGRFQHGFAATIDSMAVRAIRLNEFSVIQGSTLKDYPLEPPSTLYSVNKNFESLIVPVQFKKNNNISNGNISFRQEMILEQCAEYVVNGLKIFGNSKGESGWYYHPNYGPFYKLNDYWFGTKRSPVPEYYKENFGKLKSGIRTYDDLKKIGVKEPKFTSIDDIYRNAFVSAQKDKAYDCHPKINPLSVKNELVAMEKEVKATRLLREQMALLVAKDTKKKTDARKKSQAIETAKFQAKRQDRINEHLLATQNCKNPSYSHGSGTITCNGKVLRPFYMDLNSVEPSFLIKTKMGLIPLSPKMRRESKGVYVIAAHPNITKRSVYQCPACKGKGFGVSLKAHETRFTPKHEYRNGLKITTKTTITSTQKHYDGICGKCLGHGKVPAAWNGYNNK